MCSQIIGIADGVSTVEDEGLDPSVLPVELLANCIREWKARRKNSLLFDAEVEDLLSTCDVEMYSYGFPLYVLTKASMQCKTYGSTTCVIGILENDLLWTANIGDSQLIVVRRTQTPPKSYPCVQEFSYSTCHDSRGRVPNHEDYGGYQIVYRTVPQQHFFNCPYQLSRMPDTDCSVEAIIRRTAQTAEVGSVQVQTGDIVILGTDGLFDNVFDDDLLELLNRKCWPHGEPDKPPSVDPNEIVEGLLDVRLPCLFRISVFIRHTVLSCICDAHFRRHQTYLRHMAVFLRILLQIAVKAGQPVPGVSSPIITPFSKAAFDEVGRKLIGGKPDDITAVVAYVVTAPSRNKDMDNALSLGLRTYAAQKGEWSRGPSPTQACNGESAKTSSGQEAQLNLLEGLQNCQMPRSAAWGSRSSFPPRLHDITTPAIKASVHSVPKALKATEYLAFEKLKAKAQQRLQKVASAKPKQSNKGQSGSMLDRTLTALNAFRNLFYSS